MDYVLSNEHRVPFIHYPFLCYIGDVVTDPDESGVLVLVHIHCESALIVPYGFAKLLFQVHFLLQLLDTL